MIIYQQCELRREIPAEGVTEFMVIYLPKQFAVTGITLRLRRNNKWEDGWVVRYVYLLCVRDDELRFTAQQIREHRKNTGDSMRKRKSQLVGVDKRADLVWQIDDLRAQMSDPIEEDHRYDQLVELEYDLRDLDARHKQELTMWKPPTLEVCAAAIKIPASRWTGRCHEISGKLINSPKLDIEGLLLYGHYWGPISPKSLFKGLPFSRHGWIKLKDGRIFDPTRWVFEAVHPYIHVGFDDEDEYDAGGNKLRRKLHRPPPLWETGQKFFRIDFLRPAVGAFVGDLFGEALFWPRAGRFIRLTPSQTIWLGSLALPMLGDHAKDIYKGLIKAGRGACIPIDNRQMIIGDAYDEPGKNRTSRRSRAR